MSSAYETENGRLSGKKKTENDHKDKILTKLLQKWT
jgi:hypothetical protein